MKLKLTPQHVALLQSIALAAVELQNKGEVDTGPGGDDAIMQLREADEFLHYLLDEEAKGDAV
jgi:hypothetical protein